jgi:hypothetical protein
MTKILIGLLFLATTAYAEETIYHPHSYQSMAITWQTVPDVDAACRHEYRKLGKRGKDGHKFLGCAIRMSNGAYCLVITGEHTTHEILGHEIRHCYDGAFHD